MADNLNSHFTDIQTMMAFCLSNPGTQHNVTAVTQNQDFKDIFFMGNSLAMRLYAILTLNGHGKRKLPMIEYDKELQLSVNTKGTAFNTSIGLIFANQKNAIMSRMAGGKVGTFIYARDYDLNRAKSQPRLWSINCYLQDGEAVFNAHFGNCKIMPMLPYELVGVQVIAYYIAQNLRARGPKIYWHFDSITTLTKGKIPNSMIGLTKLPTGPEIFEVLRLEKLIRDSKPPICPWNNSPLSQELTTMIEDIYAKWCSPTQVGTK